jgi:hypothetical protein
MSKGASNGKKLEALVDDVPECINDDVEPSEKKTLTPGVPAAAVTPIDTTLHISVPVG